MFEIFTSNVIIIERKRPGKCWKDIFCFPSSGKDLRNGRKITFLFVVPCSVLQSQNAVAAFTYIPNSSMAVFVWCAWLNWFHSFEPTSTHTHTRPMRTAWSCEAEWDEDEVVDWWSSDLLRCDNVAERILKM